MPLKTKLTIIISHPVQHFSPVYQLLGAEPEIDLLVVYFSDAGARGHFDRDFGLSYEWDLDLLAGYRSRLLSESAATPSGFWQVGSRQLFKVLSQEDPDWVMVYGYSHLLEWQAWLWAKIHGRKLVYISDSTLVGYQRSTWRRLLKELPIRLFFSGVHTFLSVGDRNLEYLKRYGAKRERIKNCPLSVDIRRFRDVADGDVRRVRAQIAPEPGAFVILFSGKFIARKRPLDVIAATTELRTRGVNVIACMLGSGPLEQECKLAVERLGVGAFVHFAGFVNQREIPLYYHMADACVITSERDAHPLIATEAAACGLPIIASSNIGCIGPNDVVRDGINGIVYDSGNVKELAAAVEKVITEGELRARMSQQSKQIAETQDITVAACAITNAVREK
jgi:glycosyltransferase involved in cell wall biosynthesis